MEFSPYTNKITQITILFELFSNLIPIWKNLPPNLNKDFIEPPCMYAYVCVMYVPFRLGFQLFSSPLKSLSPVGTKLGGRCNRNQIWEKDATRVPLYVIEVKDHMPRPKVIWGQVRQKMYNSYDLKSWSLIGTKHCEILLEDCLKCKLQRSVHWTDKCTN